jgi:hypothetical protein
MSLKANGVKGPGCTPQIGEVKENEYVPSPFLLPNYDNPFLSYFIFNLAKNEPLNQIVPDI